MALGVITMKLHRYNNNTDIWRGGTNSGIFHLSEKNIMIIDPGLSESRGRRFVTYADKENKVITHVVTTHEHSDHIGALKGILDASQEPLLVADSHAVQSIEQPDTFLSYINGGAPNKQLRGFFRKVEHDVKVALPLEDGVFEIENHTFRWIYFGGHSIGSGGLLTPDKVLFLGDTLIPSEILTKFKLPLIYDVNGQFEGFERLRVLDFDYCVTGHGRSVLTRDECLSLVDENEQVLRDCIELIQVRLKQPQSKEALMAYLIEELSLELNYKEFLFGRSSLASILSHLIDLDIASFTFSEGQLLYHLI